MLGTLLMRRSQAWGRAALLGALLGRACLCGFGDQAWARGPFQRNTDLMEECGSVALGLSVSHVHCTWTIVRIYECRSVSTSRATAMSCYTSLISSSEGLATKQRCVLLNTVVQWTVPTFFRHALWRNALAGIIIPKGEMQQLSLKHF